MTTTTKCNSCKARTTLENHQSSPIHRPTDPINVNRHNCRDLSHTRVTSLPTRGLERLRRLRLKDVWSLRKFPQVEHLTQIERAELTYSQHCCSLARRHDRMLQVRAFTCCYFVVLPVQMTSMMFRVG